MLFKILKIEDKRYFYVWNIPLAEFSYNKETKALKLLKILPDKISHVDVNRPTFYLKVNCMEDYTYINLQHWIDIAHASSSNFYIICDKKNLEKNIYKKITFHDTNINIISSCKNLYMKLFVNKISGKIWKNAAYAHITTFYHAEKNHIKTFWNIDADDTTILLDSKKAAELLKRAEDYADTNGINVFSLDMHVSKTHGKTWTLGVSYVHNEQSWLKIFSSIKNKSWVSHFKGMIKKRHASADSFITYLGETSDCVKIGTFYNDNLYFIHWKTLFGFTVYCWQNGYHKFPLLADIADEKDLGCVPISDKCTALNMEINPNEYKEALKLSVLQIDNIKKYMNNF